MGSRKFTIQSAAVSKPPATEPPHPQSLKINFNFIATPPRIPGIHGEWTDAPSFSISRRLRWIYPAAVRKNNKKSEARPACRVEWNMQINRGCQGAESGGAWSVFQHKPNIYENAKAFLRFTPGKLHQQIPQSPRQQLHNCYINVNGLLAGWLNWNWTKLAAKGGEMEMPKTEHELRFKHWIMNISLPRPRPGFQHRSATGEHLLSRQPGNLAEILIKSEECFVIISGPANLFTNAKIRDLEMYASNCKEIYATSASPPQLEIMEFCAFQPPFV